MDPIPSLELKFYWFEYSLKYMGYTGQSFRIQKSFCHANIASPKGIWYVIIRGHKQYHPELGNFLWIYKEQRSPNYNLNLQFL